MFSLQASWPLLNVCRAFYLELELNIFKTEFSLCICTPDKTRSECRFKLFADAFDAMSVFGFVRRSLACFVTFKCQEAFDFNHTIIPVRLLLEQPIL